MKQLVMRWINDEKENDEVEIPKDLKIVTFSETENAMEKWLDIVQYGLTDGKQDKAFFDSIMTNRPFFDANKCFFIVLNEKEVATFTVICDYEKKDGYIHMVAAVPECRGRGIGSLMNKLIVYTLKKEGMQTAWLTTDDWRIPAIKSYFRAGFTADESTEEFIERWKKVREAISDGQSV